MRVELLSMRGPGIGGVTPSLISQWRVGAVIEAVALRDAASGQLWLRIGNDKLPARIASGDATGPKQGEVLQLRVLRTSPVLALETVSNAGEPDPVQEALRVNLPRQSSPAPLLANLAFIAQNPQLSLPENVREAAADLWQALPQASDVSNAEGLEKALARSGTLLEATLAHAAPAELPDALAQDLKALLLTLKQSLTAAGGRAEAAQPDLSKPAPLPMARGTLLPLVDAQSTLAALDAQASPLHELAKQADGALARLTTTQLINSEGAGTAHTTWMVEVPVRRDDEAQMLRFRFERKDNDAAREPIWSVEAALDLGEAGALHARVSLQGHRIGVQLRGDSPALVAQLAMHSDRLSAMLRDAGLQVDRVLCLHGMPVDDAARPSAARLLDVRA